MKHYWYLLFVQQPLTTAEVTKQYHTVTESRLSKWLLPGHTQEQKSKEKKDNITVACSSCLASILSSVTLINTFSVSVSPLGCRWDTWSFPASFSGSSFLPDALVTLGLNLCRYPLTTVFAFAALSGSLHKDIQQLLHNIQAYLTIQCLAQISLLELCCPQKDLPKLMQVASHEKQALFSLTMCENSTYLRIKRD